MTKTVLVPIANGSEEIESVCIIDTLRRAGIEVTVAKVADSASDAESLTIVASRKVQLVADVHLEQVISQHFDVIALPGGLNGAKCFAASQPLVQLIKQQKASNKYYAAICASPALVFAPHGILENVTHATCFPSMQDKLPVTISTASKLERVVVDDKCITSQGPATAIDFAVQIISVLLGDAKAKEVGKAMLAC